MIRHAAGVDIARVLRAQVHVWLAANEHRRLVR